MPGDADVDKLFRGRAEEGKGAAPRRRGACRSCRDDGDERPGGVMVRDPIEVARAGDAVVVEQVTVPGGLAIHQQSAASLRTHSGRPAGPRLI